KNLRFIKDYVWTLVQARRYEEAAHIATQLTHLAPKDFEMKSARAKALEAMYEQATQAFRRGRFAEAVAWYQILARLEPNEVRFLIGIKRYEEALRALRPLQYRHPRCAEAYALAGRAHFLRRDYADSVWNWDRAVRLSPSTLDYDFGLAEAIYFAGQPEKALA